MEDIENSIEIKRDPISVLNAFTEQKQLKAWWGVERSLVQLNNGGLYTLAWMISESGFGYVSTGIVRQFEAGRLLDLSDFVYLNPEKSILGPMTVRISVDEVEGGSRLKIVQGGYQKGGDWDWYHAAVKAGWPMALNQLKEYLES